MNRVMCISLFTIVSIALLGTMAAADTGCFLEPESEHYCTQIEPELAEFECSLYGSCTIQTAFAESKRCTLFEECQQILCQSTCEYQFAGACSSGPVPEGEDELWCQTEGCCRWWSEGGAPGCQTEENKWSCHIAASNAGADTLNWDQTINQNQCEEICLAESYPFVAQLPEYQLHYYKENSKVGLQEVDTSAVSVEDDGAIVQETHEVSAQSQDSSKQEIVDKLMKLLAPFFLCVIVALLLVFFYGHRHTVMKDIEKIQKLFSATKTTKEQVKNAPKRSTEPHTQKNSATSVAIELSNSHHKKHKRHKKHAQFELAENFGNYQPAESIEQSGMSKLKHIVKKYDRKVSRKKRSKDQLQEKLSK